MRACSIHRRPSVRARALLAAALVCIALVLPTSAFAARTPPGMPPAGKIMLGMGGTALNNTQFDRLAGGQHKIHLVTITWDESRFGGWDYALMRRFEEAERGRYRLMVHIGPTTASGREGRSPGAVARGAADRYLLDLGRIINERDEYIYVRPPAEMNGHWSVWAAFNRSGTRRDAHHSTLQYRRAFIRIAEIVRGGSVSAINLRLRRAGMPPLATTAETLPRSGKISLVWNPQAEGSPNVRGNQPQDYYPGAGWVDYVATDIYEQSGSAAWAQNEAFYRRYQRAHPFMVAEFAPWGYDGAAFVTRMFAWARSHPRTVALMYFNGTGGTAFRLASKPRSLAAYKRHVRHPAFRCPGLSATSATC